MITLSPDNPRDSGRLLIASFTEMPFLLAKVENIPG